MNKSTRRAASNLRVSAYGIFAGVFLKKLKEESDNA